MRIINGLPIRLLLVALVGGYIGYYYGGSPGARSLVFFIVAAVFLAEFFSMIGRTKPGMWDALAISMALIRLSIINYFFSLGISYSGISDFPEWWWIVCRTVIGVTGSVALYYMLFEDAEAWRRMSNEDRLRSVMMILLHLIGLLTLAIIW